MYDVSANGPQFVREIDHYGSVPGDPYRNSLSVSVDLTGLRNTQPLRKRIRHVLDRKLLWAFYYPWYHLRDWSNPKLKDHPVSPYSSSNSESVARQVEQAQSAGIDGFISSWWGPGTYSDKNLKILLQIARHRKFLVSIYFETLKHGKPRTEDQIFQWLAYVISTYRDHPSFMKVDGKPLIVIWTSQKVPLDMWKHIFGELRDKGLNAVYLALGRNIAALDVFDGLHEYGVFTIPNPAKVFRRARRTTLYYPLLADISTPKIWAATAQPGYDESRLPGRKGQSKDRDNGASYRATLEAAIQSHPDWIFISTWNEWWENTYIERSEMYGDQYLGITREFAEKWKGDKSRKQYEQ